MATEQDDTQALRERVAHLEARVETLASSGVTRRQALLGIGGTGLAAAGLSSLIQPAAAQTAAGQIGDSSTFLDIYGATIVNHNYVEPQVTATEGSSYTIDVATGNYHRLTLTGDVTIDVTGADSSDVNSVLVQLVQDGTGGRTPTFSPTVVWPGGNVPEWSTDADAIDVVTLVRDQEGGQWLGFPGGVDFA